MAEFDKDNPLAAEILAEKASAYFTTIRKMNAAIEALGKFDAVPVRQRDDEKVRSELLMKAAEQVLFFLIQREAMRLPYYEELFADFEIPDEIRKQLGRATQTYQRR